MRIRQVEAIPLQFPVPDGNAYGMARGLAGARTATLVRVDTDEGLTGLGEAWGPPEAVFRQVEALAPQFVGRDPFDLEAITARILGGNYHLGLQGLHITALSGLDIACWDLMGKAVGRPVAQLLGGIARREVQCYASTGYFTTSGDLAPMLEKALEGGFQALKIKIGHGMADDVARVRLAREVAGDQALLLVDINGNYTADAAIASTEAIRAYGIHWVEEPVTPADIHGFERVREKVQVPIATGEAEFTRYGFRELISRRLVDVLQPDVTKVGGLLEAKTIARMAQAWHIRVSPHVWGGAVGVAAGLHLACSLPDYPHTTHPGFPLLFEYDRAPNGLRDDLLAEPLRVENGVIYLPDGPGLGITLDERAVNHWRME
jgi:D-galactarolactone cycloisomerase